MKYNIKLLNHTGTKSYATSINSNNADMLVRIAGGETKQGIDHAAISFEGIDDWKDLPVTEQQDCYPVAINDNDQIAGSTWVYDYKTKQMHDIASMLEMPGVFVTDINNAGIITLNHSNRAYAFQPYTYLGPPLFIDLSQAIENIVGPKLNIFATAINNSNGKGQVAGFFVNFPAGVDDEFTLTSGFVYDLETSNLIDVGLLSQHSLAEGWIYDINKSGKVIGRAFYEAFICNTNSLGLNEPFTWANQDQDTYGNYHVEPYCINDNDLIVGTVYESDDFLQQNAKAFMVYGNSPSKRIYILNDLVESPDWDLKCATSVNNKGQIVGVGNLKGEERGFFLDPKFKVVPQRYPRYKYGRRWPEKVYPNGVSDRSIETPKVISKMEQSQ